jgi:PAS domain S-box-containing protein
MSSESVLFLEKDDKRFRRFLSPQLMRESEDRYRSLFESGIDGILLTAPDGTLLDANPAACRIYAGTQEELRAVGKDGVIDPADHKLHALAERIRTGRFAGELTLKRKDGRRLFS